MVEAGLYSGDGQQNFWGGEIVGGEGGVRSDTGAHSFYRKEMVFFQGGTYA